MSNDTTKAEKELRFIMPNGATRVVKGRTALAVLKLIQAEDVINNSNLKGKFWIYLQGSDADTQLEMDLTP